MSKTVSVELSRAHVHGTIRILRKHRQEIEDSLVALEERLKMGGNGSAQQAILALSNELAFTEEVIRELWKAFVMSV